MKILYFSILVLYIICISAFVYKLPIAYKMEGLNQVEHLYIDDFNTHQEYQKTKENIENTVAKIYKITLWGSFFFFIISLLIWIFKPFRIRYLIQIMTILSGLIFFILFMIDNIHFIPGPPIR